MAVKLRGSFNVQLRTHMNTCRPSWCAASALAVHALCIPGLLLVVFVPTVCGVFGQQEKAMLILAPAGAVKIGSLVEAEYGIGLDVVVD
jgi:hypothetical protein